MASRKRARGQQGPPRSTEAQLALAAALDEARDFTSPHLSALDSSLRCPICTELYTAPVLLTTCSHSFDSRCLREYLARTKRCPTCSLEANEDRIRRNLALDELVRQWKAARPDLLRLQAASLSSAPAGPSSPSPAPASPTTSRTPRTTYTATKRKAPTSSSAVKSEPRDAPLVLDDGASSDIEIIEDGGGGSGASSSGSKARARPPKKKLRGAEGRDGAGKGKGRAVEPDADPADPSLIVQCPLCGGDFKNALISLHVDRCNGVAPAQSSSAAWGKLLGAKTEGRGSDGESPGGQSKRLDTTRPLPLASYAHKSVAELSEMLSDYGLPTTLPSTSAALSTDAKLAHLQRRHRQFLTLWNANADLSPDDSAHKSAKELRDELARWEKVTDAGAAEVETVVAKSHAKQYAAEFRELIAQARASALKAKQQRERQAQEPQQEQPTALTTVPAQAGAAGAPFVAEAESPGAPTPAPAAADADVEMSAAPLAAPDERALRKRSVRLVSPERSPPGGAAAVALGALSPAGVGSTERDSPSPPPPALPPPRVGSEEPPSTSDELESGSARTARRGKGAASGATRTRSPSPFDPEGPKPSQRNREEERMFARMAGRDEDEDDEDE